MSRAARPLWRRPLYRAAWKVQRNLWGRVFVDAAGDHRHTVYVAGSGRSGTTWLAELINYRNEYRYIFEPLTPPHVPAFAHFRRGQYLRLDNHDPRYREPLAAVLTGRMRHRWIDHYNRVPVATKRLVKDVYANLLLKWLTANFPGMKIVFVIRHPCAVMTSRLSLSADDVHQRFDPGLERFLDQDDLMADVLEPFRAAIVGASSVIERQAFWWCIENYVPLRQCAPEDLHVVCYERLRLDAADEIPRLGAYLGRAFDPSVFAKMRRRSLTTGPYSALQAGGEPATNWTRRWAPEDVRSVMRVLSLFGLDAIYTDAPMPSAAGVDQIREDACVLSRPA